MNSVLGEHIGSPLRNVVRTEDLGTSVGADGPRRVCPATKSTENQSQYPRSPIIIFLVMRRLYTMLFLDLSLT